MNQLDDVNQPIMARVTRGTTLNKNLTNNNKKQEDASLWSGHVEDDMCNAASGSTRHAA